MKCEDCGQVERHRSWCHRENTRLLLEEAWDAGYTSGHSNAMRKMSDEPNISKSLNPYRAKED